MPRKLADPFDDKHQHLKSFPDHVLRDLVRNESADMGYRSFAFELLYNKKSPYVQHEDFKYFREKLEAEFEGIQFEFPAPSEETESSGPLTAGVTTKTMFGEPEVIDNSDVQKMDEPVEAAPEPKKRKKSGEKNAAI